MGLKRRSFCQSRAQAGCGMAPHETECRAIRIARLHSRRMAAFQFKWPLKQYVRMVQSLCLKARKMENIVNTRFKYTLAFLIGAVITAAALRHVGHVYGGFSREELRVYSLIAAPAATLAFYFAKG
jgi:hypothetical protein